MSKVFARGGFLYKILTMSEHIQASQENFQTTIEQMRDALQFDVGTHILGKYDRDRPITYEDDMPIVFASGFFFFCKGEHVLRHAPEAAEALEIKSHYDLEFRYSPAHLMPACKSEEDVRNNIYDTTLSDEVHVERALLMVSSEGMMLYSIDNGGEFIDDDEPQYGGEIHTDADIGTDMDGNPMTSEQLMKAMERSYEITPKICRAIGDMAAKLSAIKSSEDVTEINDQEAEAYRQMDIF